MKHNKIPFANRDIDRITKVSSTATSTGSLKNQKSKGSFKVQRKSVTYNDSTPVGVHAKSKSSSMKNSKNYVKKYKGQGK